LLREKLRVSVHFPQQPFIQPEDYSLKSDQRENCAGGDEGKADYRPYQQTGDQEIVCGLVSAGEARLGARFARAYVIKKLGID
jgi:hypothetical protein